MLYSCIVNYKYRKNGTSSWTVSNYVTHQLKSQSETIVLQKLREKHKNCEIELIKIDWK